MRGFPLVNAVVILLALGLVLVPLLSLTSSSPENTDLSRNEVVEPSGDQAVPVAISLRYAHRPGRVALSHLGKVIWQADAAGALERGAEVSLVIPPEGIDLLVHAVWLEGTPESALEITLEPEALPELSQVIWGRGEVEDVVTFVWGAETR